MSASTPAGSRAWAYTWATWLLVVVGLAATVLTVVVLSFIAFIAVTAGPSEDTRKAILDSKASLLDSCEQRFYIGVYDEPCLSLVRRVEP